MPCFWNNTLRPQQFADSMLSVPEHTVNTRLFISQENR